MRRGRLEQADAVSEQLTGVILADLGPTAGETVDVLVNGLGATPIEELYVLYRHVQRDLDRMGAAVRRTYVGEFATSLEMAGASLSVMRLDAELAQLLDAPARSPFFRE